jgi:hypothetical protein
VAKAKLKFKEFFTNLKKYEDYPPSSVRYRFTHESENQQAKEFVYGEYIVNRYEIGFVA